MNEVLNYRFIAIEGNIGTGKTTLCKMLSSELDSRLILEQFTDNPFLPYFYEHPERYGFPVELFFMTERFKQLQACFGNPNLFQDLVMSDYFFIKTLLFAHNNLNQDEFNLFQRLFHILNAHYPNPDLLVYLHRDVDILVQQIEYRGRDFESGITREYLLSIQNKYLEYFKSETDFPVLIIDVGIMDFLKNKDDYAKLKDLIFRRYNPGVHYLRMVPG